MSLTVPRYTATLIYSLLFATYEKIILPKVSKTVFLFAYIFFLRQSFALQNGSKYSLACSNTRAWAVNLVA